MSFRYMLLVAQCFNSYAKKKLPTGMRRCCYRASNKKSQKLQSYNWYSRNRMSYIVWSVQAAATDKWLSSCGWCLGCPSCLESICAILRGARYSVERCGV